MARQGTLGPSRLGAKFRIRRARASDAAIVARLANALNRHEGLPPRLFTTARMRRDAFGPRRAFRVLVAEAGGRIVGYASFLSGYNSDVAAREIWLLDLFVVPGWRSRGVGRALIGAVAGETVRRGLAWLEWGVRGSNTRALRFYHRLGARVSDTRIALLADPALGRLAARYPDRRQDRTVSGLRRIDGGTRAD